MPAEWLAFRDFHTQSAKRFSCPSSIVHTDGSKVGTSLTGAVFQAATGLKHSFKLEGHDASLNTALHAELAALHRALTLLCEPQFHGPQIILTDSLTSIWLIRRAIYNPEFLRDHKHKRILHEIIQMIVSRSDPISIYKVRAHTGVTGNTAADKLAGLEHDLLTNPENTFADAGTCGRGATWIQYAADNTGFLTLALPAPAYKDVDTLKDHVFRVARAHFAHHIMTPKKLTSVLTKIQALLQNNEGIDTIATRSIWKSARADDLRIAIRIRVNRLHTTTRQHLLNPDKTPDTICPRCHQGPDDADHALNKCAQPQIIHEIKARHDHAGVLLFNAIQSGARGSFYMHSDLCTSRQLQGRRNVNVVPTSRKLPAWVLPRSEQHSFPDIFIIDILENSILARKGRCYTRQQRGRHSIDIIEIKYKYDLEINNIVHEALAQHADLKQSLLAYGWQAVRVHAFIIGSAGTISNSLHTILTACGLAKIETRQRLLKNIAYNSVVRTARIVRLSSNHNATSDADTPQDMTRCRTTPTEDPSPASTEEPPPTSRTGAVGAQPIEDALIPTNMPETCLSTLPLLHHHSSINEHCPLHASTEHTKEPDSPPLVRRSTRKRKLSRYVQEPQETNADTTAVQPAIQPTVQLAVQPAEQPVASITPLGHQQTGAVTQQEQVCRNSHKRKTTSQEKDAQESSRPGTRLKKRADTRLRANTRTDTFPPMTSLTQNNDAHQITLLPTRDTTPPQPTQFTDFVCLSNQDSIALSRNRRCAQRPQRLCHSPSRGRSRIKPQPETPKESPRPKRRRRPPNRTSPPPQPKKRQKYKQDI